MNAREIKTVAVVGASGEMGRVFVSFCRAAGQEVRELGRPLTPQKLEAALAGADLVLLCVPIGAMRETLGAVAPHLTGGQILTDACSVKSVPLEQMLRAYAGPVVGTHPMFGGNLPEKSERRVAVTPGRIDAAAERVSAWLAGLGFAPFATTAREHDQSMALIQGLNFVTTVSYLSCTAPAAGHRALPHALVQAPADRGPEDADPGRRPVRGHFRGQSRVHGGGAQVQRAPLGGRGRRREPARGARPLVVARPGRRAARRAERHREQ